MSSASSRTELHSLEVIGLFYVLKVKFIRALQNKIVGWILKVQTSAENHRCEV